MLEIKMNSSGICRILLVLACPAVAGAQTGSQHILIDHTTTDLLKIPDYWIEQARKLTLYYGFTSHGTQIVSGLEALKRVDPKYDAAILRYSSTFRCWSTSTAHAASLALRWPCGEARRQPRRSRPTGHRELRTS